MEKELTIEQMGKANTLLQELVDNCNKRWSGKKSFTSYEAYSYVDKIYETIHGDNKNEQKK